MHRLLKRSLWACLGLYVVLGTYAWNVIYALLLIAIYPKMTNLDAAVHPSCIPGDWVLQTFQPMVSDARLVKHWQEHKADMTLAAEMAVHRQHVEGNGLIQEARDLYRKISIEGASAGPSWSMEPYSLEKIKTDTDCLNNTNPVGESKLVRSARVHQCIQSWRTTILMEPTFGKTHQQFFCTTSRNTFKQYIYFPEAIPKIVDGYLMGPIWIDGKSIWKKKIVPSTDVFDGKECTVRQLDGRWFISLC